MGIKKSLPKRLSTFQYLGTLGEEHSIRPQKVQVRRDHLKTLSDWQILLGDINWICPFLKLTMEDHSRLFTMLCGDPNLTSS